MICMPGKFSGEITEPQGSDGGHHESESVRRRKTHLWVVSIHKINKRVPSQIIASIPYPEVQAEQNQGKTTKIANAKHPSYPRFLEPSSPHKALKFQQITASAGSQEVAHHSSPFLPNIWNTFQAVCTSQSTRGKIQIAANERQEAPST